MFWHLSGSTTAYNFQTPVNSDFTLYAKWQEKETVEYWQVAWQLNGGSWPGDDNHATQVVKGGALAEPSEPVKEGSTFDGWYKEADLTCKVSFPYDVSSITGNFVLYAKWATDSQPGAVTLDKTSLALYTTDRARITVQRILPEQALPYHGRLPILRLPL